MMGIKINPVIEQLERISCISADCAGKSLIGVK